MSAQGENYASVGSVGRSAVPVNFIMAYGVAVLPAAIAGVALHGVDKAVLHLLHDAHMVGKAVLGAGAALVVIAIGTFTALVREQQSERIFPRFAPCVRLSPHTALHQYRLIVACM